MAELQLRAGSRTITPSASSELAGYIARDGALSTGTHDDLEAALVVLDDGARSVAWLALDAIGVTAALSARLRDAVVAGFGDTGGPAADAVMVCASHTHSAPLGWSGSIHPGHPGEASSAMVAELCNRVEALASELARRPAVPVTAEWLLVGVTGLGGNRLSPDGPHDDRAGVLVLRDAAGAAAAMLVDFATHPTVLGPANLLWSADWPGAAREQLRTALGGTVVAFLQGAAGDVSTRFTRRAADFAEATRLGGLLADAVRDELPERGRRLAPPSWSSARTSVSGAGSCRVWPWRRTRWPRRQPPSTRAKVPNSIPASAWPAPVSTAPCCSAISRVRRWSRRSTFRSRSS